MKPKNLRDLLIVQLQDLYSAEKQIVEALPKMSEAAESTKLKKSFDTHLEQTHHQIERLREAFEHLGEKVNGKVYVGMQGLIKEGEEVLKEEMNAEVRDAALIAAAQKVEHYEIAGYGTARAYARLLKDETLDMLLLLSLDEEGQTDEQLTNLAMTSINLEAK